jgi:glycosyltransferase involved in cell wall biosynthesis
MIIENPKISIIVPVYNSEKYLEACLDSIIKQTYSNFEIILVNDGSTDSSYNICSQFAEKYNNIVLINQENKGVAESRNVALENCTGEYVSFIDSDDYVEPEFLYGFVSVLKNYPSSDWIIQGIIIDYPDRTQTTSLDDGYSVDSEILDSFKLLGSRFVNGFTVNKLYKLDIIQANKLNFQFTLKEDLLFNLKYCNCISSIATTSKQYYHYIQSGGGSLIHKRYSAPYMKELIVSLRDAGLCLASHYNDVEYRNFVISDYMLSYAVLIFSMYDKNNTAMSYKERMQIITEYHQYRRENNRLKINCNDKRKKLFVQLVSLPGFLIDILMKLLSPILNK